MINQKKKTSSVLTRVSPELKDEAEAVLNQLQIPMSTAINMFLQQVVNQRKIPFEITLAHQPINYDNLSKSEFDAIIKQGFADFKQGNSLSAKQVRNSINEEQ